jgi:hypothetical protein
VVIPLTALRELADKLPAVEHWIDELLARHRPAASPVATLPFERLRRCFQPETLAASVVLVDRVPTPPLAALGLPALAAFEHLHANAVTYRDTFFVERALADDEALHFHELVHVVQWRVLGPRDFLRAYAAGLATPEGYAGNPLEVIAYGLQEQFEASAVFRAEPLIERHLRDVAPSLLAAFG